VALNLGLLVFFKYSPLLGRTFFSNALEAGSVGQFLVNVPLPIGISFFIFQGISLVVEVFRSERAKHLGETPEENPLLTSGGFLEHLRRTRSRGRFYQSVDSELGRDERGENRSDRHVLIACCSLLPLALDEAAAFRKPIEPL
jgi:hypothetical protein